MLYVGVYASSVLVLFSCLNVMRSAHESSLLDWPPAHDSLLHELILHCRIKQSLPCLTLGSRSWRG